MIEQTSSTLPHRLGRLAGAIAGALACAALLLGTLSATGWAGEDPPSCASAADCDDMDPCTSDFCFDPDNFGSCDNGSCECFHFDLHCCETDPDCAGLGDTCNPQSCVRGFCQQSLAPDGTSCGDCQICCDGQCEGAPFDSCSEGVEGTVSNLSQRGNANQKGSLLMFPKIAVDTAKGIDTLIDLTNAGDRDVTVTCYWIDGRTWERADFHFDLTKRQPAYFRASDGLPGPGAAGVRGFPSDPGKGELKCWASDTLGGQIKYNFLKGEATITDAASASAWEYPAVGFQCRQQVANGEPCGTPGTIRLNGCEFDACPGTLELDFFSSNDKTGQSMPLGGPLDTDIALVPCTQDLRQEGEPVTTKEKYDLWNENETKFTGLTRCLTCFDHTKLSAVGGGFKRSVLHTEKGLARIDGVRDDRKCCPKEKDSTGNLIPTKCSGAVGLVGVQVKEIDRTGRIDRAGDALVGAGGEVGQIDFDLNDASEEGR
jgi:hypothetical protein